MMKLVFLVSAIAVVAAIEIHQPHHEIEEGPVEYEFSYAVHDEHTGDIKSQKESRKDDRVEGSYELIDSDGYRRLVQYKSDKHSGFEAVVHREPTSIKIPIPEHREKLIATKVIAAPIVHYAHAQPQHHVHSQSHSVDVGKADYGTHVSYSGPEISYNY